MKYVVYEIWTRSRIIEARNDEQAYRLGEPIIPPNGGLLNLSNWHIQPFTTEQEPVEDWARDDGKWL